MASQAGKEDLSGWLASLEAGVEDRLVEAVLTDGLGGVIPLLPQVFPDSGTV